MPWQIYPLIVTLFRACVGVTDYSEFEDVFHKKFGTKTSLITVYSSQTHKNVARFAFLRRRTICKGFWENTDIFALTTFIFNFKRVFLAHQVFTTCPTWWHNLPPGWGKWCRLTMR